MTARYDPLSGMHRVMAYFLPRGKQKRQQMLMKLSSYKVISLCHTLFSGDFDLVGLRCHWTTAT